MDVEKISAIVVSLIKKEPISIKRLGSGKNSRVYCCQFDNDERKVLKFYFKSENDSRNRLDTEYKALEFLNTQNISNVPKPILKSEEHHCAIYEYIESDPVLDEEIQSLDVKNLVSFIQSLNDLREEAQLHQFAPASEACFSINELLENLSERLNQFDHLDKDNALELECKQYLESEFVPMFNSFKDVLATQKDVDCQEPLKTSLRILSPSDVGFHNARKTSDKKLAFFDFEYFGWDDPAKLLADFLIHPAMNISQELRREFVQGIYKMLDDDRGLSKRLEYVYPLYGLKWCLIFLNEFRVDDKKRREFVDGVNASEEEILTVQLNKAKELTKELKSSYADIQYATR